MQFLNGKHKRRFAELLKTDETHPQDVERRTQFYIISGNENEAEDDDELEI